MTVSFRPEIPRDEPFVRSLILETIARELGAASWPEPMRTHLLELQYKGRRRVCRADSPAKSQIIQADGSDAGWCVVTATPSDITLVEIMILPALRGRGIGSEVIRGILTSAAEANKPVRLNVNLMNKDAIRLYDRLEFHVVAANAIQLTMECRLRPTE